MSRIPIDPDSDVVEEHFAVVYAPRRHRDRFPENCVEIVDTEQIARDKAGLSDKSYAAKVVGPSRSSEGFRLFYLEQWLD